MVQEGLDGDRQDNNHPASQLKPELDAEQQRHKMEADIERCELEGRSTRHELTAQETDQDEMRGCRVPQELRGVEPSYKLDVE